MSTTQEVKIQDEIVDMCCFLLYIKFLHELVVIAKFALQDVAILLGNLLYRPLVYF